jgi:solute carrier family 25 (adenine nucleotide translocator) protein 4/5/6/31
MNQTSAAVGGAVSAESSTKAFSPAKDAVAGAFAGGIAKTVVAPIERVKLIMQLNTSSRGTTIKRSHGAWEVTKQVYREQGILAFWRGNTPNVIRQAGSSAMNFLLMDWYKVAISPILVLSLKLPSDRDPEKRNKRRALISSFLSGGLAGGSVTTVLYPVEFVRTRLAMDLGRGTVDAPRLYPGGMKDVCISIWKADGWRGLYQGYGIAVAGVVLYRALHLGGYDAVKTEILHRRGHLIEIARTQEDVKRMSPGLTMGERFLAAQIVSVIAGTACYPIDSIRRRLMMQ